MSLTTFNGLPMHVILIHFVVVAVPLTSLAVVVAALSGRGARRLGMVLPVMGLVTLGLVPVTTHAGEWLKKHVGSDPLVRRHAHLGDGLLPWVFGLFLMTAVLWWLARRPAAGAEGAAGTGTAGVAKSLAGWVSRAQGPWRTATVTRVVVGILAIGIATGSVVDVYRIGDSGAKAAWHDSFSKTASGSAG